jgi:hypothetical protein
MFQQIVLIQALSRYITVYITSMMERKSVMRNNVHDEVKTVQHYRWKLGRGHHMSTMGVRF